MGGRKKLPPFLVYINEKNTFGGDDKMGKVIIFCKLNIF